MYIFLKPSTFFEAKLHFVLKPDGRSDGRSDCRSGGRSDGRTDGRTDGRGSVGTGSEFKHPPGGALDL